MLVQVLKLAASWTHLYMLSHPLFSAGACNLMHHTLGLVNSAVTPPITQQEGCIFSSQLVYYRITRKSKRLSSVVK